MHHIFHMQFISRYFERVVRDKNYQLLLVIPVKTGIQADTIFYSNFFWIPNQVGNDNFLKKLSQSTSLF